MSADVEEAVMPRADSGTAADGSREMDDGERTQLLQTPAAAEAPAAPTPPAVQPPPWFLCGSRWKLAVKLARVIEGVLCLLAVAVIWVAAGALVQYMYESDVKAPFFLTYVCNSEFIVLLPLRWYRERSTLKCRGERGAVLMAQADKTDWWRAARAGAIVSPLWFLAQGSYNWSLAGTSVSSSTVLSTSSCVFTFLLSLIFLRERFHWSKLLGVLITVSGAVMTSYADAHDPNANAGNTWWGDALALFSAAMYGVYTTAIKRLVPDDGSVSIAVFFGFLGLFNAVFLSPIVGILYATGVEPIAKIGGTFLGLMLVKGLFDNVLSDLLWARAIHLTSATVATVALSLTIPLAMLSDLMIHHTAPLPLQAVGAATIAVGFVLSTISLDQARAATTTAGAAPESPAAGEQIQQDGHTDSDALQPHKPPLPAVGVSSAADVELAAVGVGDDSRSAAGSGGDVALQLEQPEVASTTTPPLAGHVGAHTAISAVLVTPAAGELGAGAAACGDGSDAAPLVPPRAH